MTLPLDWVIEAGPRLEGARDLDRFKVQAPCITRVPDGRFRLFYTAIGPEKPFRDCQGYILSAISADGLVFAPEPGIRLAPDPAIPQLALRVLAPSIAAAPTGGWRMYFEARGPAGLPTAIMSAFSPDQLHWTLEPGTRLTAPGGVGAPRFLRLPDGRGRLICFESIHAGGSPATGPRLATRVIAATTEDGLAFRRDADALLADRHDALDSAGITAAEIVNGAPWRMVYSAWQDVPAGTVVPLHPSADAAAEDNGASADFAAASIAADMAGYRSRILVARSDDGIAWRREAVLIEGDGYHGMRLDAVHAEDMSLIALDDGRWRMYYAACDAHGVWRIASAISR
jgi:hypothetical protein